MNRNPFKRIQSGTRGHSLTITSANGEETEIIATEPEPITNSALGRADLATQTAQWIRYAETMNDILLATPKAARP